MEQRKSSALQKWLPWSFAVLIPIWLSLAHLDRGADAFGTTAIYSSGLVIAFAALLLWSGVNRIPIGMTLIAVLFLLWCASGLVGDWQTARHEIQALAAAGSIAGMGYVLAREPRILRVCWSALNWTLLIYGLAALLAFLNGSGPTNPSAQLDFDGRLFGFFGSPNTAATLFGVAMLSAMGRILRRFSHSNFTRLSRRDQIYYFAQSEYVSFALFIVAGICLLLTVSRAGIFLSLLSLIGLAMLEVLRYARSGQFYFVRKKRFIIPAGLFLLTLLVIAITGDINPYSTESLLHNSSSRLVLYDTYTAIWLERPLFGHGLGSFNALNDSHTTLQSAAHLVLIGAAHNVILQWLVQQGLLGTLAMVGTLGVIFYPIAAALKQPSSVPRHFLRMTLAIALLVFAHGLVDFALEIPSVMWTFSYIIGLAAGFASVVRLTGPKADE